MMLRSIHEFLSSCALDRPPVKGPLAEVHRRLLDSAPPLRRPVSGLRGRVMGQIARNEGTADQPARWQVRHSVLLAAGLAAAVGAGVYLMIPARSESGTPLASDLRLPVDASPMIRLVAGSVDRPLLDQAQKIVDDTRRATRAVVRCIPFANGG